MKLEKMYKSRWVAGQCYWVTPGKRKNGVVTILLFTFQWLLDTMSVVTILFFAFRTSGC